MRTRNELSALLHFLTLEALQKRKYIHYEELIIGILVNQTPPDTFVQVIGLVGEDEIFGNGFSRCQKEDKFDSVLGTIIALHKAVNQAVSGYFGDQLESWWGPINALMIKEDLNRVVKEVNERN